MASDQAPRPLFCSTTDAAQLLSVSPQHVRDLVESGDLPGCRMGRKVLVSVAALDALAGPQGVSSRPSRGETVREIRRKYEELGRLITELGED